MVEFSGKCCKKWGTCLDFNVKFKGSMEVERKADSMTCTETNGHRGQSVLLEFATLTAEEEAKKKACMSALAQCVP